MISSLALHWKNLMRDELKSFFFFLIKKYDAQKGIFFLFYQIVLHMFFLWKNLSGKSLPITILLNLLIKTLGIWRSNTYWIKTKNKNWLINDLWQWTITLFKFSLFYFFRLNWVGCLFHCNTGNRSKIFSTLMFRNTINLKPVVGTYMGRVTPVYNGKKISQEFPSEFPFI